MTINCPTNCTSIRYRLSLYFFPKGDVVQKQILQIYQGDPGNTFLWMKDEEQDSFDSKALLSIDLNRFDKQAISQSNKLRY